jgi:hypothetical protein
MFPISQIRVARPTENLSRLIRFYEEGLLLNRIGEFKDHDGYSGVMLGMPDASMHLEFTQHAKVHSYPKPSKDNLLVFYFDTPGRRNGYAERLNIMGYPIVEPENSYWLQNGITIEDPDGWRVVLVDKPSFSIEMSK